MEFMDEETQEHFRYLQQSIGQNFASVLNNPRENETKSWSDWLGEASDSVRGPRHPAVATDGALPPCTFPTITVDNFVAYCTRVEKLLANFNASHHKSSQPKLTDNVSAMERIASLPGIPSEFFSNSFDFFSSQTFGVLADPNQSVSSLVGEKLLHDQLETVEMLLFRQVRARSGQFFKALTAFRSLKAGVTEACDSIKTLRAQFANLDDGAVAKSLQLAQLYDRRQNMQKLATLLSRVRDMRRAPGLIRTMLANSQFTSALELIEVTTRALQGELAGIAALRGLYQQLYEIKLNTVRVMQSNFLALLAANPPAEDRCEAEASRRRGVVSPLVRGLLQCGALQHALQTYKSSLLEMAKKNVNDAIVNSIELLLQQLDLPPADAGPGSAHPPGDAKGESSKTKKQNAAIKRITVLEPEHFLFLIDQVFEAALAVCRSTCFSTSLLMDVIGESVAENDLNDNTNTNRAPQNTASKSPLKPPTTPLSAPIPTSPPLSPDAHKSSRPVSSTATASDSFSGQHSASSSSTCSSSSYTTSPLSTVPFAQTFGSQLLLETVTDTRANVIGVIHSRIIRLFEVRAERHETLRFEDFIALMQAAFAFVNKCSTILCLATSAAAATPMHSTLIGQSKTFFVRQHDRYIQSLATLLAQEPWKAEKEIQPSLQTTLDQLLSFKPADVTQALQQSVDKSMCRTLSAPHNAVGNNHKPDPEPGAPVQPQEAAQASLLSIRNHGFPVVSSVFLLIQLLSAYDTYVFTFPFIAIDILQRLHDVLKTFISQTKWLVLGAGALETGSLKMITTHQLALAIQCLLLVQSLIPALRSRYALLLPPKHLVYCDTLFEKLVKGIDGDRVEFYTKIVNIMKDRLSSTLTVDHTRWMDLGENHIRALVQELGRLWKVLKVYFHPDQVVAVLCDTVGHYNAHLKSCFAQMPLQTNPDLRTKVLADLHTYRVNIERFGIAILSPALMAAHAAKMPSDNEQIDPVIDFFVGVS